MQSMNSSRRRLGINSDGDNLDWLARFGRSAGDPPTRNEKLSVELVATIGELLSLYIKTKYFHWLLEHSPIPADQLLLEEQADEIFATSGLLAAHVKQRNAANASDLTTSCGVFHHVTASAVLTELQRDTLRLARRLKTAQLHCERDSVATAHLLVNCIDETEARLAFIAEAAQTIEVHGR
jgi:starvation-inducible DNA-binding protein